MTSLLWALVLHSTSEWRKYGTHMTCVIYLLVYHRECIVSHPRYSLLSHSLSSFWECVQCDWQAASVMLSFVFPNANSHRVRSCDFFWEELSKTLCAKTCPPTIRYIFNCTACPRKSVSWPFPPPTAVSRSRQPSNPGLTSVRLKCFPLIPLYPLLGKLKVYHNIRINSIHFLEIIKTPGLWNTC